MKHRLFCALASGAMLSLSLGFAASAADDDFCHGYAQAAVREVNRAIDHHRCREVMQGARWSTDWHVHYGWCRGVHRDQARSEDDARRQTLAACDPEGDWYHWH